jgi:hypothetical protein
MKKADISSSSAGTNVDSSTNVDNPSVSQPIAKPNVVRSCIQEENLYTPNCIRTFTGIYMNVFEPTLDMICMEDIAHALSNQCRFGGHLPEFYSVAQHSITMSNKMHENHKLAALLHDASEAYLLDIPSPIKKGLSNYKEIEDRLMFLIAEKFGFQYPLHEKVKEVDEYMLQWEWSNLMLGRKIFPEIKCLWPGDAEELFLTTFDELQTVTA